MSDEAKAIATDKFEFVKRSYPGVLAQLKLSDHPTLYRTYLYGVMKATMRNEEMDQYEKMYLLNMLKNEIGLSADDLAAEILNYAADQE